MVHSMQMTCQTFTPRQENNNNFALKSFALLPNSVHFPPAKGSTWHYYPTGARFQMASCGCTLVKPLVSDAIQ